VNTSIRTLKLGSTETLSWDQLICAEVDRIDGVQALRLKVTGKQTEEAASAALGETIHLAGWTFQPLKVFHDAQGRVEAVTVQATRP
jgi:hypothetical protein